MKKYFLDNLPKISLYYLGFIFCMFIVSIIFPSLFEAIVLYPINIVEPLNWYRFITHPYFIGGFYNFLLISIFLIIFGIQIERVLNRNQIITVILISSILSGLVFATLNYNFNNIPLAGCFIITWAYSGIALVLGIKNWKNLILFEKIVIIFCFVSIFDIFEFNQMSFINLIIQLTFVTLTYFRFRKFKFENTEKLDNNI